MLLSLVLHMYSMRCVLPAAVMLGTAPTYVLAWGAWRLLSAFLPARFYQVVDDRLYCMYQSMVLFFFENYTGVQVRPCPPSAPGRRTCRALSTGGPRGRGRFPGLDPAGPAGYFRVVTPCVADLPRNMCRHPILPPPKSFHVLTLGFGPEHPGTSHRVTEKL